MNQKKFPESLMQININTAPPEGQELIRLLRCWYKYAPSVHNKLEYGYDAYTFLRRLLRNHVEPVIELLEKSPDTVDQEIVRRICDYAAENLPNGAAMAKCIAKGNWGWIAEELGNPTWNNNAGTIIVELPTTGTLKVCMEKWQCTQGENRFFRNGYLRIDQASAKQFYKVSTISNNNNLISYSLLGGGLWVYSIKRTDECKKLIAVDKSQEEGYGMYCMKKPLYLELAKSERARSSLAAFIGNGDGGKAVEMLMSGNLSGDLGDIINDFLTDEITNESTVVWQAEIYDPEDEDNIDKIYPVGVNCYEGVFYAWALEYDNSELFLSLKAAIEYAYDTWSNDSHYIREIGTQA